MPALARATLSEPNGRRLLVATYALLDLVDDRQRLGHDLTHGVSLSLEQSVQALPAHDVPRGCEPQAQQAQDRG
ncbi:hypothetical protein EON82_11910 [bacterium]|nr:MAG: hypothetical protein EON82_11910 [bacterium]